MPVRRTSAARLWTRDELIIVFNYYCRTPFGRLHKTNPDIVAIAERLGRTPSSVAMKAVNFASLDPAQQARGVAGLSGASQLDREIWDEFHNDWTALAIESEEVTERIIPPIVVPLELPALLAGTPTERTAVVKVRLVQRFFRSSVLAAYESRCGVCELETSELLIASHIVPWAKDEKRRGDPRNGLCLCSIHDRAFDGGLMTFDEDFRVMLSPKLKAISKSSVHRAAFKEYEGEPLHLPSRFAPDKAALSFHREDVFLG
jgi:hypothetical protein